MTVIIVEIFDKENIDGASHHRIDPYPIPNDTKLIYIMNHN